MWYLAISGESLSTYLYLCVTKSCFVQWQISKSVYCSLKLAQARLTTINHLFECDSNITSPSQPIFKFYEGSTSVLSESWRPFASFVWEKALCLAPLGQITIDHEVAPPFLVFLHSDVSEKAWPRQLPLNKKEFTLKSHNLPRRAARLCIFASKFKQNCVNTYIIHATIYNV